MNSLGTNLKTAVSVLPDGATIHLPLVTWDTYRQILADLEGDERSRLLYDHGNLYIMTKSRKHDTVSRLFIALVEQLVELRGGDFMPVGSATLNSRVAASGLEADECFYFSHFDLLQDDRELDLAIDPPPDLAIEVDYTSSSVSKEKIYAALRIPELWRWDNGQVTFWQLRDGAYHEITHSQQFPALSAGMVPALIQLGRQQGFQALKHAVREQLK